MDNQSGGSSRLAVLIPAYKPKIDGLELFSLQHSLNVLNQGREVYLICPQSLDHSFYSTIFPGVKFAIFDDYYFLSISAYSKLLMSKSFYEKFQKYEFVLISQTDAILLRDELDYWCERGFDYVGAPWPEALSVHVNTDRYKGKDTRVLCPVGNGGLSLRRVSKCMQLIDEFPEACTEFANNGIYEDLFFSIFGSLSDNFSIPDITTASCFSMEIAPEYFSFLSSGKVPMGGHAWWRYNVQFWLDLLGSAADPIREEAIRQHAIEIEKIRLVGNQAQKAGQNPPL